MPPLRALCRAASRAKIAAAPLAVWRSRLRSALCADSFVIDAVRKRHLSLMMQRYCASIWISNCEFGASGGVWCEHRCVYAQFPRQLVTLRSVSQIYIVNAHLHSHVRHVRFAIAQMTFSPEQTSYAKYAPQSVSAKRPPRPEPAERNCLRLGAKAVDSHKDNNAHELCMSWEACRAH